MKIRQVYLATSEAMLQFGINRVWLHRHKKTLRRKELIENGRNKVFYHTEDIRKGLLRDNPKTTTEDDDTDLP